MPQTTPERGDKGQFLPKATTVSEQLPVATNAQTLDTEALLARVKELESRMTEKELAPSYVANDASDDRNDIVTITFGPTLREYRQMQLPKKEAVDYLYNHYAFLAPTGRNVPKFGAEGVQVNDAPCYVKIRRRDAVTRTIEDYYKDMPLWILVDRMINHPQTYLQVQLVRQEEYMADARQFMQKEHDDVTATAIRNKKLEAAADLILQK